MESIRVLTHTTADMRQEFKYMMDVHKSSHEDKIFQIIFNVAECPTRLFGPPKTQNGRILALWAPDVKKKKKKIVI